MIQGVNIIGRKMSVASVNRAGGLEESEVVVWVQQDFAHPPTNIFRHRIASRLA